MSRIENLKAYDPFADTTGDEDAGPGDQGLVHIRIQQRNGRKTLTTVQGLSAEYDFKKIVKVAKKEFACNGTVVEHSEYGEVIQLQVKFVLNTINGIDETKYVYSPAGRSERVHLQVVSRVWSGQERTAEGPRFLDSTLHQILKSIHEKLF